MFIDKNPINYEQLFSELTPKLLLDHCWKVLDLIHWEISEIQEFTIEKILKILSMKMDTIDNPYYRRQCIQGTKSCE